MATAKIVIGSADQNDNRNNSTISKINPNLANTDGFNLLDRTARKLLSLTTETYINTQYVITYDVGEELEG